MFSCHCEDFVFLHLADQHDLKSFGKDEGFTVGSLLFSGQYWDLVLPPGRPYGDPVAFQAAQNPQFDFEALMFCYGYGR